MRIPTVATAPWETVERFSSRRGATTRLAMLSTHVGSAGGSRIAGCLSDRPIQVDGRQEHDSASQREHGKQKCSDRPAADEIQGAMRRNLRFGRRHVTTLSRPSAIESTRLSTRPHVPVGAHATFATTKPRRMDFSGAHDVRRRPQGLRLARHKAPLDHIRLAVRAQDLADRRRIPHRAPSRSLTE